MQEFPGNVVINHSFRQGGMREDVTPEADGYLGSWSGESQFKLTIEPKDGLYLLWRSGHKNPRTKRFDQVEILHPDKKSGRRNVYKATVGTSPTNDGFLTKSPRNHVSMFWITRDENGVNLELWEMAVVSQADPENAKLINFFFTVQLVQKSRLFRYGQESDGTPHLFAPEFPRFSDPNWEDIRRTVSTLLADVPALSGEQKPASAKKEKNLKDNQGRVLWYNFAGNNGIVTTNKGAAKVAWKNIKTEKRFRSLEAGQLVEFDEIVPTTGSWTKLPYEVRGVRTVK